MTTVDQITFVHVYRLIAIMDSFRTMIYAR